MVFVTISTPKQSLIHLNNVHPPIKIGDTMFNMSCFSYFSSVLMPSTIINSIPLYILTHMIHVLDWVISMITNLVSITNVDF